MSASSFTKFRNAALAGAAALSLGACATVPGSNVAAGSPITAEEAAQGREYDPQFIAEFGAK